MSSSENGISDELEVLRGRVACNVRVLIELQQRVSSLLMMSNSAPCRCSSDVACRRLARSTVDFLEWHFSIGIAPDTVMVYLDLIELCASCESAEDASDSEFRLDICCRLYTLFQVHRFSTLALFKRSLGLILALAGLVVLFFKCDRFSQWMQKKGVGEVFSCT